VSHLPPDWYADATLVHDICQANSIRYQYAGSLLAQRTYADRCRSFWTLSGSPTLLRHPSVLSLAKQSSLTPEATVYKLCQL
jgi:hypothetical protein